MFPVKNIYFFCLAHLSFFGAKSHFLFWISDGFHFLLKAVHFQAKYIVNILGLERVYITIHFMQLFIKKYIYSDCVIVVSNT